MNYAHLTTSVATFLSGTGTAKLHRININTSAAGSVVTVYEGQTSLGNVVTVLSCSGSTAQLSRDYGGIHLAGGMFVAQTGGNADITISYD